MRATPLKIATAAALIFAGLFSIYLWTLYRQLVIAFDQPEQFIPTRIYSDVTRLAPPMPREHVESRLQSLGYSAKTQNNTVSFQVHAVEYPAYLLPDDHPQAEAKAADVTLTFDSEGENAALQSIHHSGAEVPDLFLEPELVATLSRGTREIRALVRFGDIPSAVWKAIIAVEDQHYLEHAGLDPRGIARAIWVNLRTLSLAQGGSTITQQLVKNLMARRTKNLFRKLNELFLALILEARFGKEKILERYLNEVYLGQVGSLEVHGVAEGAKHFFGKRLEELNLGETALMAGLIRGPGFYSPYRYRERAVERQRFVLKRMVDTGQIADEEAAAATNHPIRLAPPSSANKAPYFTDFVKAELIRQLKDRITEQEISSAGFKVYTTLDPWVNSAAQRAVTEGIIDLEKRLKPAPGERLEGALAAVDHTTGQIRALIGGKSYAQSNFNRILNMKRQVGSTFKPFVYLAAIEKGADPQGVAYGPGHPVEDAPWTLTYDRGKQTWTPKNYEKEFQGWTTFRVALAHSINTAAAKLGTEVGVEAITQTARKLGIESELPAVPSLALGVAELSPVELLRAYATIANHGVQDELTVIRGITLDDGTGYARFIYHPKQVIEPGPADLLTDMLQTVFTDGTASAAAKMGLDRPAAGKTGTTSNHRDSWFAGYTPHLTSVVWVGSEQEKGVKVTGAGAALPIWVRFMKTALDSEPPATFPISERLTTVRVDLKTGNQAGSDCPDAQTAVEKYLAGQEPKDTTCELMWPPSVPTTVSN